MFTYYVSLEISEFGEAIQEIDVSFKVHEKLTEKEIERTAVRKLKKLVEHSSLSSLIIDED